MGSLWASYEIIIGSFLHNLHIPFSGTILTFSSVFIIIAFIQFWKDKGLVWRAGLICALMKSISPSAVILGPMIGILTEALIIELFLRLAGRNLVSYMIAGGLVVTSALLHKVVNLFILYGLDLWKIIEGLVQYAGKQLKINSPDPIKLFIILLLIYMVAGITAAILGYITGKKYIAKSFGIKTAGSFSPEQKNRLFQISGRKKYSALLLFAHLATIIVCMWLINTRPYYIFLPVILVYLVSCLTWYKKSLHYLKKPAFWIQFIIITFLASFLLESYNSRHLLSSMGLITGLKMNLRAFVIMIGFSAIAVELKNPMIRSILYKRGFSSLYQSLGLAFSALPGIVAGLPGSGELLKKRSSLLIELLSRSDLLLNQFREEYGRRQPVIIITGDIGQGKTTFARQLVEKMISHGVNISGFFSLAVYENNEKTGFDLEDIVSRQRLILARRQPAEGWIRQGHYFFDPRVFENESERLWNQTSQATDLLLIDEVGPLELSDSGWNDLIEIYCRENSVPMIWIVRKNLAQKAARKWNVGNVYIFNPELDKEEDLELLINTITAK